MDSNPETTVKSLFSQKFLSQRWMDVFHPKVGRLKKIHFGRFNFADWTELFLQQSRNLATIPWVTVLEFYVKFFIHLARVSLRNKSNFNQIFFHKIGDLFWRNFLNFLKVKLSWQPFKVPLKRKLSKFLASKAIMFRCQPKKVSVARKWLDVMLAIVSDLISDSCEALGWPRE